MNITVSGAVITALRDHSPGCMILRPQASSDSAAGQTLVPHDMRVPLVGYWRDGVLVIEKAAAADAASDVACEVADLKAKLAAMQAERDALLARSVAQAVPPTPTDPLPTPEPAQAPAPAPNLEAKKLRAKLMGMRPADFEVHCAERGIELEPGASRTKMVEKVLAAEAER
jgi:hypothetical protein